MKEQKPMPLEGILLNNQPGFEQIGGFPILTHTDKAYFKKTGTPMLSTIRIDDASKYILQQEPIFIKGEYYEHYRRIE